MSTRRISALASVCVLAVAVAAGSIRRGNDVQCRSIPGDDAWPDSSVWNNLNQTVDGNLIATIPIAAACHMTTLDKNVSLYNEEACSALRDVWFFPTTHLVSPSSPMSYQFTNNSCNPFDQDPNAPCTVGYHVAYTINATSTAHIQAAVRFAQEHNIRLVIRNSGHDYLGKSTGAHALAVWTRHLKSRELIPDYQNSEYSGPAVKLGAGIEGGEAYNFANENGLMVVGGNCPNVGLAGGYTQGGGISILSSKFGLAADQVLSWEVVTSSGDLVTASPTENEDLFWALRGGGGGTYGIVVSMTVKAFPNTFFSTATMSVMVADNGNKTDDIYSTMTTFFKSLPSLVDSGAWVVWIAAPFGFMISPAMVADLHSAELDALIKPTLDKMDQLGLKYTYSSAEYPDFLSAYGSMTSTWNVSDYNMGSRLIPRTLVEDDASAEQLTTAVRHITSQALMSGVSFNVANFSSPQVSANPYLRQSIFNAVIGVPIDYSDWTETKAGQDKITHDLLPSLQSITPNGGVYLNEADFQAPDFQTTFYGGSENYEKLLAVKRKYDPEDIFYAKTAVGSDRWEQRLDGRLCTV